MKGSKRSQRNMLHSRVVFLDLQKGFAANMKQHVMKVSNWINEVHDNLLLLHHFYKKIYQNCPPGHRA